MSEERMNVNLGISTDLLLNAQHGNILHERGYITVKTPAAPDYYFGNLLVLEDRPKGRDLPRLEQDFSELVGRCPVIKHRTFLWSEAENMEGDFCAYLDAGYDVAHNCVLIAERKVFGFMPTKMAAVSVRKYCGPSDWDAWMSLQLPDENETSETANFPPYLIYQKEQYQKLVSSGIGEWWGAYIGEEQVANLGVFFFGRRARFQNVTTAKRHRNKGICQTLVQTVAEVSFDRAEQLIVVADEYYFAGRIYQKLGFRRHQWTGSLCKVP